MSEMEERIAKIETAHNELVKLVQAACRAAGADAVQRELAAGQRAEMEHAIVTALKEGKIAKADVVTLDTLVVGVETAAGRDGYPVFPGRFQIFPKGMDESAQKVLMGKKAGESAVLSNKNTIKVLEIYSVVEPKAPEAEVEAPKKPRKKSN